MRPLPGDARTFEQAREISRAQVQYGRGVLAQFQVLNRSYTRDGDGKFSSTGGVRQSLADAKDVEQIGSAAGDEAKRITGRDIPFDFAGSDPQIAREHAEGVLRGLERFPAAPLVGVHTYGPGHDIARANPDAFAVTRSHGVVVDHKFVMQGNIYFNVSKPYDDPAAHRARLAESDHLVAPTATGTALHEFGHVLGKGASERDVYDRAVEMADAAGASPRHHITRQVSSYASSSMGEFTAEIVADVMANGSRASDLSRESFKVLEDAYS